jgi:hypothetical protein
MQNKSGTFSPVHGCHQRECMGLLEYQAMPSFRDVAHDGVLCTFSNRSGASCVVRQGRRHGPSMTYKITPCLVTLLQQARQAAVLGQHSIAFGLIGCH